MIIPVRFEDEVRAFLIANRGKPYTREDVVRAVAHQRLDALLNTEYPEYCQNIDIWIIHQRRMVSLELADSVYEKTFANGAMPHRAQN